MNSIDAWRKTKLGLLAFALLELAICYGFASLAIDRGSWWWYLLTLILLFGFLQNGFKFGKVVFRG